MMLLTPPNYRVELRRSIAAVGGRLLAFYFGGAEHYVVKKKMPLAIFTNARTSCIIVNFSISPPETTQIKLFAYYQIFK
jgi:hypothetical protein